MAILSPELGWGSEVSCPRTLPQKKNSEDPVWLKPRTPGFYVLNTVPMSHA